MSYFPYYLHHDLDTKFWQVLDSEPGTHRVYGPYRIWWDKVLKSPHYYNQYDYKIVYLAPGAPAPVSCKDWQELNRLIPDFHSHVEPIATAFEVQRKKDLEKARKERNEAEAKQLGISVKELIQRRKEERLKEKSVEAAQHTIEQINQLTKVSGQLKRLIKDIHHLEGVIEKTPEKLNIHSVDNYIRNIRRARNVVRVWSRKKRISLYDLDD